MWTFRNGNVFVLLFWTIYGPAIVNATPPQTVLPIGGGGAGDSTAAAAATINQPCDRTRRVFTEPYGEISDGPVGSNYTQNSHCEWLIKARNESQFITLTFQSMGTECSYDYIFVYDGDSFRSPLLGSFSGKTEPQKIIATSGSMLILLYSDTNYVLEGFKAEFYVSNCPNNCSQQGKCVGHQCVCQGDWIGKDCSLHACPESCGAADGHGLCSKEHCRCLNGYSGKSCSLSGTNPVGNEWHWMSTFQGGLTPRAAHTAVYVAATDALYVFGGYDLNSVLGSLQIYRFNRSTWEDEWGLSLRSRHFPKEIDNELLKAVLHQDPHEAIHWGLKNDKSFFRNILLTISDHKFSTRTQRSPVGGGIGGSGGGGGGGARNETHDLTDFLEEHDGERRPADRYGHAVAAVQNGFVIFGGKLANGTLSNELWYFNATVTTGRWQRRALNSSVMPPACTRHTLTASTVDEYLYVFGGSLETGEFSSKIYRIRLNFSNTDGGDEQWQEVRPRGGKSLDVRVVAHTTVYHAASNSLYVYGGVVAGFARFSKLSDRMFAFQLDSRHWSEILYPRTPLRDAYIPRERAFHTATIVGNYMIIFGGYSHRHNKEEICYDNQMYLYHLGCHTWVNQDVLGESKRSQYPKQQGVFAHAATVRNGHTLLVVGGYHGNVNADLLAYTLPPMFVAAGEDLAETVCPRHAGVSECLADPECGWCSADNVCYGRTIGANCTTNLQTTRCPGICPALGDCHACLIHGLSTRKSPSVANKLGLNRCTWCVQNARCHHRADNYGICGEDTPSQEPGWWGPKGTEVLEPDRCTALDRRPGLTFLKYLSPVNWTQPDDVTIVNATTVDFVTPSSTTHTEQHFNGEIVARLLGYIRPPKQWQPDSERFHVCASYSLASLRIGDPNDVRVVANISAEHTQCQTVDWSAADDLHQHQYSQQDRFLVDFQARRTNELTGGGAGSGGIGPTAGKNAHYHQHSQMSLQHNGSSSHDVARAFTFEYLEPFSNGSCESYSNCQYCLSNADCGWCDWTEQCVSRATDEMLSCRRHDDWRYLTLQPSKCANCSNFIACDQCVGTGLCEWWAEEARCSRLNRAATAVRAVNECPAPCYERRSCSACLEERGRCVWCEATEECFAFAVYTSEYQFGMCREWLDQVLPVHQTVEEMATALIGPSMPPPPKQQCKSCGLLLNCSACLQSLSCGWCFDRDNPIEGICMHGDFNRSTSDCAAALRTQDDDEAEWAYAQCPDVDECGLGLHDCHKEAKCTNTHGSYNCHCRRGFIGDGRTACVRTCYEQCAPHGVCSASPDYVCRCDLGWTGSDCATNCGCNNHSTCTERPQKCDKCLNWTEGEHCERCRAGSYGNATAPAGCRPCECNGHGNQALGICDVETGECYCQDNTEGLRCEVCNRNFYGDPAEGGQCYFQCEARGMLRERGRQGIGSYQSHKNYWGGPDATECLWIVSPHAAIGGGLLRDALIQLSVAAEDLNVKCGENAVYVYDGPPDLIGKTPQSQLLAVFCTEDNRRSWVVEARSGHLTVHYKQGAVGQGFNATYTVRSCSDDTCLPPHACNVHGQCTCLPGFTGAQCELEICARNCSAATKQGNCDRGYGRCVCHAGFGGADCSIEVHGGSIVVTELFNSQLLSESLEHLRKTLPRFGHSLVADKRGSLWMFGGYSLSHGPLNDIRQFDTKNNTWMQVTVDSSTPDEARMPQGRYFHAADIVHARQIIYIYGGLSGVAAAAETVLDDFWMFNIATQRWDEIVGGDVSTIKTPPLAGQTMTLIKDADHDGLLLVGGFSHRNGLNNVLYEFDLTTQRWTILTTATTTGTGPIGLYGHTTVFHQASQVLYVFGGYEFTGFRTEMSNRLYSFDYGKRRWSLLPVFRELNPYDDHLPRARFLHSAITTDAYMLVFGGRTEPKNSSDVLIAYVYECNQWIRLTKDVHIVGTLPTASYAAAMTLDQETEAVYVAGGWDDGSSQARVARIRVPADLCELWSSGKYNCRHFMGCSFCAVKTVTDSMSDGGGGSHCYSHGRRAEVCDGLDGTLVYNRGATCDAEWMSQRNCSAFTVCAECLAAWPAHPEERAACSWCSAGGCHGQCISAGGECKAGKFCSGSGDYEMVAIMDSCPSATMCAASDCQSCAAQPNCAWSYSAFDSKWTCMVGEQMASACGARCEAYTNCSSCLSAATAEGGFNDCRWSTQLNECISPSYQPIYCVGGVCGLVLTPPDVGHCPEPCNAFTQCATCLRHAHCGWCSRNGTNGDGVCTEGSLDAPADHPAASTCDIIYASYKNRTIDPEDSFRWAYVKCPRENECTNEHHNCDAVSESCVDLDHGYDCVCGVGYKAMVVADAVVGGVSGANGQQQQQQQRCQPVCQQGCVRGRCTAPNVCECAFGYVGANCSIQCQCNGHSDCRGPDRLDECILCRNNTIGAQCDKCQPLFVGDARNNGECVPCLDYCNGHTDICVARDTIDTVVRQMNRTELERYLSEGPMEDAICLRCANNTADDQCEGCVDGTFRGSEDYKIACRPCQCHGHGDSCDPVTGEKCNCGNNTESDATCSASASKNSAQQCWMVQCSKCRDSYAGNPTDGHQCYKQITVESKMCFDAKTIDECKKPAPLKAGQTVFFFVQPRFMNVDIRIIVDVTQGEIDLWMSPQEDSFVVVTNQTTGQQKIYLDHRYAWFGNGETELLEPIEVSPVAAPSAAGRFEWDNATTMLNSELPRGGGGGDNKFYLRPNIHDCHPLSFLGFSVQDRHANSDLSTYVTLTRCNILLRVYGLKNRLVLSLPQTAHNLSATRFFIAMRATNGPASYGLVFFRQDQLHIDLFVFFSVFFSCFFLFLAVCVVAWKTKQAADLRRARRQHVVEMLHMAKRPFSSVTLLVGPGADTPPQVRRRGRTKVQNHLQQAGASSSSSATYHQQHHPHPQISSGGIRPVAVEPTADGTAAVGTVFVRLPGKSKSPATLALGSSLTIMVRHQQQQSSSINSRTFLRRRGSQNTANSPVHVPSGSATGEMVGVAPEQLE